MTRVLLVEDNPADVLLLRELLELLGVTWTIEDVPTFAEAVQRWSDGGFGALVTDLNVSDGHGLELLARALELASGVPVVVLSGLGNPKLATQTLELGARGYVVKGLDAAEHLQRIVAQFS